MSSMFMTFQTPVGSAVHWILQSLPSLKTEVDEGSRGVGSARTDESWRKDDTVGQHGDGRAGKSRCELTWRRAAKRAATASMALVGRYITLRVEIIRGCGWEQVTTGDHTRGTPNAEGVRRQKR
jgi:hypothetical protein